MQHVRVAGAVVGDLMASKPRESYCVPIQTKREFTMHSLQQLTLKRFAIQYNYYTDYHTLQQSFPLKKKEKRTSKMRENKKTKNEKKKITEICPNGQWEDEFSQNDVKVVNKSY